MRAVSTSGVIYPASDYQMPMKKLRSKAAQYLKPERSLATLVRQAKRISDTECTQKTGAANARHMRQCKLKLPCSPNFGQTESEPTPRPYSAGSRALRRSVRCHGALP